MTVKRNIWNVLIITIALIFAAGCAELSTGADQTPELYSYVVNEFQGSLFNSMSAVITMNDWFLMITNHSANYDSWAQNQRKFLYRDNKLQTPFTGSDIINEDTEFYCEISLNGQGKKTGQITGTITLTDIPHPGTKVQIRNYSFAEYPNYWWNLYKKIDMSTVTGTSAALNWSLPVYEMFKLNSEGTFELIVLPGNSLNSYTVTVPQKISLSSINENIGSIGTVSIKGVTLSGTININYNGEPVPCVELYALYPVQGPLNITILSSPGPNAPWSLTYGKNQNNIVDIEFKIIGYSGESRTLNNLLFDISVKDITVVVTNNQDVSGIILDIGDANSN